MAEYAALERAVQRFGESIAEFPVGAVSLDDLKPTAEKIQDLRATLKRLRSHIIILKAKEEVHAMPSIPTESTEEVYDRLQEQMAHCAINRQAVEVCLYGNAIEPILHSSEDTEIKRTLQDSMQKLFTFNDSLMALEEEKLKVEKREKDLTFELKESLLEFNDFLKDQSVIRKKKLEETNPKIAEKKAQMQKRVQKINVMKRLITNMIATSGELLEKNLFLQEMMMKHRDLIDVEIISKMALEKPNED